MKEKLDIVRGKKVIADLPAGKLYTNRLPLHGWMKYHEHLLWMDDLFPGDEKSIL